MDEAAHDCSVSIGTAIYHIDSCIKRRNLIVGTTLCDTDEGVQITVRRLNRYRQPVDTHQLVPGVTLADGVTEQIIANYAIAAGIGRVGERPGHNARLLLRQTCLYRGLDGAYHITPGAERGTPYIPRAQQHLAA